MCYVVCADVLLRADHSAAQRATQAARVPSPARPARARRRVGMRDFHTVAGCWLRPWSGGLSTFGRLAAAASRPLALSLLLATSGPAGAVTSAAGLCRETARRLPKGSRPRRRLLLCSVVYSPFWLLGPPTRAQFVLGWLFRLMCVSTAYGRVLRCWRTSRESHIVAALVTFVTDHRSEPFLL